jgi:hypothetical protein
VVADLQALCQEPHGHRLVVLETLELQKEQILLRLHPGGAGRDFTHTQELPDPIPQLGKRGIVDDLVATAPLSCPKHEIIIS